MIGRILSMVLGGRRRVRVRRRRSPKAQIASGIFRALRRR